MFHPILRLPFLDEPPHLKAADWVEGGASSIVVDWRDQEFISETREAHT